MKKETLLTVTIVLLLMLNFGTLSVLWWHRPPRPPMSPHPGVDVGAVIANRLHFTEAQNQRFELLKRAHRDSINQLDDYYRQLLVSYLQLLRLDSVVISRKDSLEQLMSAIEARKAAITLNHFNAVKKLCSETQKPDFDALIPQLIEVIAPPPPPARPPNIP